MKVSLIARICSLLLVGLLSIFPFYNENVAQLEKDKQEQITRINALENDYKTGKRTPVNESDFFDGDLEKELNSGMKYNELACVATHNSYQRKPTESICKIYTFLHKLTFGKIPDRGGYEAANLIDQLDSGIRSIELDIETMVENGEVSFVCIHSPAVDMPTNSYSFEKALEEIKIWSNHNPNHLPITIIIEPKVGFVPMENMDILTLKYCKILDEHLREILGDKLFTPKDMLRDYSSFSEMRQADDWCQVKAMLGKVVVALHDTTLISKQYINLDKSIKTQAMFPMVRNDYDKSYASFVLMNSSWNVESNKDELFGKNKLVVRTMADEYSDIDSQTREKAANAGAQIVSTDYPLIKNKATENPFTFENNKQIKRVG